MSIDFSKHSVWISRDPVVEGKDDRGRIYYTLPSANSFFYLGGNTSLGYSNNYNTTVMGMPGAGPDKAVFVDSGSGSVSTLNIECTRAQPAEPLRATVNNVTDYSKDISNAEVIRLLRDMKKIPNQVNRGAYILRLYNTFQKSSARGHYFDIPVYINSFSYEIALENPNTMSLSLAMTKRNLLASINIGESVEN